MPIEIDVEAQAATRGARMQAPATEGGISDKVRDAGQGTEQLDDRPFQERRYERLIADTANSSCVGASAGFSGHIITHRPDADIRQTPARAAHSTHAAGT